MISAKYKPGIYFGIYFMVMCAINPFLFTGSVLHKYNIWGIATASVLGGIIGGFMFVWLWSLFKTHKAKSL